MKSDAHHIIKAPVITEEASLLMSERNQYVFRVDRHANKAQVRDAIERLFNVRVLAVNTMNYTGKRRRRGRIVGQRPDWKKAVVTLHPGDKLDLI